MVSPDRTLRFEGRETTANDNLDPRALLRMTAPVSTEAENVRTTVCLSNEHARPLDAHLKTSGLTAF